MKIKHEGLGEIWGDDENVFCIDLTCVTQLYTFVETHSTTHLKQLLLFIYKLYFTEVYECF